MHARVEVLGLLKGVSAAVLILFNQELTLGDCKDDDQLFSALTVY